MSDLSLMIPVLVFVTVIMLSMSLYSYMVYRKQRRALVEKIKVREQMLPADNSENVLSDEQGFIKRKIISIVTAIGQKASTRGENAPYYMRQKFLKAGYRRNNAPIIFLGLKLMLAVSLPLLFFAYRVVLILNFASVPIIGGSVILALFGFYLPNIFLKMKIAKRKEVILKGFPDSLDLLVVCVESGMGLDSSIQRVGEEMRLSNRTVAEEFDVLSLELRAGKPRREALRNLAMRTDLEDVSSLMSLLIQTDKFGTSVVEALRVHAESMRTRRFQKAEEIAAKIPVKLIFPLIFFIFPTFFLVLVGPAIIQIIRVLLPALRG